MNIRSSYVLPLQILSFLTRYHFGLGSCDFSLSWRIVIGPVTHLIGSRDLAVLIFRSCPKFFFDCWNFSLCPQIRLPLFFLINRVLKLCLSLFNFPIQNFLLPYFWSFPYFYPISLLDFASSSSIYIFDYFFLFVKLSNFCLNGLCNALSFICLSSAHFLFTLFIK